VACFGGEWIVFQIASRLKKPETGTSKESKSMNESLNLQRERDPLKNSWPPKGLRLNFRGTPLRTVLNYLCDAADLSIEVEPNVEIERAIDLWNDELLGKQETLLLLKKALRQEGYITLHKGGTVAIINGNDAKKHCIPLPIFAHTGAE
jgi:hypothetical protein